MYNATNISNDQSLPFHISGPKQRRSGVSEYRRDKRNTNEEIQTIEKHEVHEKPRQKSTKYLTFITILLILFLYVLLLRSWKQPGLWLLFTFPGIIVLGIIRICIRSHHANERLLAATFVFSILSNQLPQSFARLLAALALAIFSIVTRPEKGTLVSDEKIARSDDLKTVMHLQNKFLLSCLFMIAVLLHENFQVWVVAATFTSSHRPPFPTPLQDNGKILITKLIQMAKLQSSDIQYLRDIFNVQWIMVSLFACGLVICELKIGEAAHRNMWSVGTRALLTLGIARLIRTVSFLLTVLPSQMPSCYRERYPYPVPTSWSEWIMIGLKPAARGGCNDLVISGHATVTSTLACVAVSVANNIMFSVATWSLLAFDYMIEIYQGFHYSIDMWLGAVVTTLVFRSLSFIEMPCNKKKDTEKSYAPLRSLTYRDIILYLSPALIAFIIVNISNEAIANLWVAIYVAGAVVAGFTIGFHLSRHVLFCTLYIALITYL
jgi:hypothetical protein